VAEFLGLIDRLPLIEGVLYLYRWLFLGQVTGSHLTEHLILS